MLGILRRVFSFTSWTTTHPNEPPPGDMLDASFDAQDQKISEIEALVSDVRRSDGGLQNGVVTIDSLAPELRQQLRLKAAPRSGGSNGDELGWKTAEATAQVWSYASKDWAEHMPDTIPEDSVAVMDITGDHWSSRWWAHQAAITVGSKFGGIIISDTAPPDPSEGVCWWSSVTGNLHIWYIDQDSAQWVQVNTAPVNIGDTSMVTAMGGTELRTLASHFGDILNAKDFGAKGDNVADDTVALNAFFAAIRSAVSTAVNLEGTTIRGVIPPGIYRCGNVNATGIDAFNWILDCQGAVLHGVVAGKPVLDMYGCRWATVNDLTIVGNQTGMPTIGLQQGRVTTEPAGDGSLNNVRMYGWFSKCCYYNFACETMQYNHPVWYNNQPGPTSYVLVMDDRNGFGGVTGIPSDHIAQTNPVGTRHSFIQCQFNCADLRKRTGGKVLLMIGNLMQHHYLTSYMVSVDDYAMETQASTDMRQMYFDVHVEAAGALGMLLVDNTTPNQAVILVDFRFVDEWPWGEDCLINLTGNTQQVIFDGVEIRLGQPGTTVPLIGGGHGGDATKLLVNGTIVWGSQLHCDLTGMLFNGELFLRSQSATVTHTAGAYKIVRRPSLPIDRINEFKGALRANGHGNETTPTNYIDLQPNLPGNPVAISVGGSDASIDIDINSKGSSSLTRVNGSFGVKGLSFISPDTGSAELTLRKSAVTDANNVRGQLSSGLGRWTLQLGDGTAESGSNAGSDFQLVRYNDAGGGLGNPITIPRATGVVQLASGLSVKPAFGMTAGGALGMTFSSVAGFGVYYGSGAPLISAAKGSLYLRSDGTGTGDRMYVNTNGSTTWTAVTTAA